MWSNRPDRRATATLVAALALTAVLVTGALAGFAPGAGAQSDGSGAGGSSGDPSATTTVSIDTSDACGPGHIVVRPNCGAEPTSATDRGGWLQVSLFYLICGAVVIIIGSVWWRSRNARRRRAAAGLDPVTLARQRGEGLRPNERATTAAD